MLPVYVISLKQDVEKRAKISNKLNSLNIDFEFVDAIYGKELSKEFRESLMPAGKLISRGFNITPGEIGCSLSHCKVYELIVERKQNWACILEDDVILDQRFNNFIMSFSSSLIKPNTIYILGGQNGLWKSRYIARSFFSKIMIGNQVFHKAIKSESYILRTCCYVISGDNASIIKNLYSNNIFLADDWVYIRENNGFNHIYISDLVDHPLDLGTSAIELERVQGEESVLNRKVKTYKNFFIYKFFRYFYHLFLLQVLKVETFLKKFER